MYVTNQFRKGLKIELDGIPYNIVDFQFVSPGKGGAFVRTKLKNLFNGNVIERTFKSGDKVDKPDLAMHEFQYLYKDESYFHFMNQATYEQIVLDDKVLGGSKDFLQENIVIQILFHNEKPIGIELPTFVELKIIETDPGFKGDTVSNSTKPAKLETGASVQVPLHLKEGEVIKVDTRDYSYIEKVNK